MTLNQIFNDIQYGKDYAKNQIIKESVEASYDEDSAIFYASDRIKKSVAHLVLSESEESKIGRLVAKLQTIEERMEQGKIMSDGYRKLQSTAIQEDCNNVISAVENIRKIDSEKLEGIARVISTTKYFMESNVDEDFCINSSTNPIINKLIKEDYKVMANTLENM